MVPLERTAMVVSYRLCIVTLGRNLPLNVCNAQILKVGLGHFGGKILGGKIFEGKDRPM